MIREFAVRTNMLDSLLMGGVGAGAIRVPLVTIIALVGVVVGCGRGVGV